MTINKPLRDALWPILIEIVDLNLGPEPVHKAIDLILKELEARLPEKTNWTKKELLQMSRNIDEAKFFEFGWNQAIDDTLRVLKGDGDGRN